MERKLTAILCADVFGYSRLMRDDEEATLGTLSSHRKLIDSLIEQYRARFVNSAGDSVLAEFASVVNAVQCAVEIQTTLKATNANLPPGRRMEFRIGVNLGDVIVFVQHLSLRPPTTTASIPPAQSPALTLPDKPSIAEI